MADKNARLVREVESALKGVPLIQISLDAKREVDLRWQGLVEWEVRGMLNEALDLLAPKDEDGG